MFAKKKKNEHNAKTYRQHLAVMFLIIIERNSLKFAFYMLANLGT